MVFLWSLKAAVASADLSHIWSVVKKDTSTTAILSPPWLISPYFRDSIACLAHTAYFPVCLQGKTSSYHLGPLSSWFGASSSGCTQYHQYLQRGALGFHSSCFDHGSQVRCEFLVTLCSRDCNIKFQLLKQIRGEIGEGTCWITPHTGSFISGICRLRRRAWICKNINCSLLKRI